MCVGLREKGKLLYHAIDFSSRIKSHYIDVASDATFTHSSSLAPFTILIRNCNCIFSWLPLFRSLFFTRTNGRRKENVTKGKANVHIHKRLLVAASLRFSIFNLLIHLKIVWKWNSVAIMRRFLSRYLGRLRLIIVAQVKVKDFARKKLELENWDYKVIDLFWSRIKTEKLQFSLFIPDRKITYERKSHKFFQCIVKMLLSKNNFFCLYIERSTSIHLFTSVSCRTS